MGTVRFTDREAEAMGTTVNLREACETVTTVTGTSAALINTGGGCGALEARLEAGAYLLVTDGDVFYAYGGDVQDWAERWTVGVYADDEHGDSLGYGYGPFGDCSQSALRQALTMALDPSTREH